MSVYTSLYEPVRLQTVNGKGQPLVATLDYGAPYAGSLNDERILAAGSAGKAAVRDGVLQYNAMLSPSSNESWFRYNSSGSVVKVANGGPVTAWSSASGLPYLQLTTDGSGEWWGCGQTPGVSVLPSEAWNFSFWAKTDGSFNAIVRIYIDFYNNGGYESTIINDQYKGFDGGAWSRHSVSFTVASGGTNRTFTPYGMMSESSNISPAGRNANFTGFQATRGLDLKPYFDGVNGPPTKGWVGTPQFSASYRLV